MRLFAFALVSALAAADAQPTEPPLRSIGFLTLPGVFNELMAPYDVLHHIRFWMADPKQAPEVFTVAKQRGPIRTYEGLTLTPQYSFADAPPIDLLVVPSAEHNMDSDLRAAALIGREAARKIGEGLVIDWDVASLKHRIGPHPLWPVGK